MQNLDLEQFSENCYNAGNLFGLERVYLNRNIGKQVNILLFDGKEETLFIKGACKIAGAFRYVGHKAKKPRTPLETGSGLKYSSRYSFPPNFLTPLQREIEEGEQIEIDGIFYDYFNEGITLNLEQLTDLRFFASLKAYVK